MGGEVILLMAPGEIKKVRLAFEKATIKGLMIGPLLRKMSFPPDVWWEYKSRKLEIGYSFGDKMQNSEWATAIGREVVKHFKVEKAGWDSVGYCNSIDDFMRGRLFPLNKGIFRTKWYKESEQKLLDAASSIFE